MLNGLTQPWSEAWSARANRTRTSVVSLTVTTATFLVIACAYVWFATAGTWHFRDTASAYFDALGASFLRGQLYLPDTVPAALLALPNPYDPEQRKTVTPTWPWDSSLYHGHFYLYWGPALAIVHAIWHLRFRSPLLESQFAVAIGLAICFVFWLLVWRLKHRAFAHAPEFLVWGSLLAFGLGGMLPYLIGRPSVYNSPILLALLGLMSALFCLAEAIAATRRRRSLLCLAGIFLGWAIASRITYVAYAMAIGLVVVWVLLRRRTNRGRAAGDLMAFTAPVVVAVLALLAYNWARFDSPFEFGQRYQLAGTDQTNAGLTCGSNLLGYVGLYFLSIPRLEATYPFVPFSSGPALPSPLKPPVLFPPLRLMLAISQEPPIMSVFLMAPIGALTLSGLWLKRRLNVIASAGGVVLASLLGIAATTGVLTCANGVDGRYFGDLAPTLSLAGTIVLLAWADQLAAVPSASNTLKARRALYAFAMAAWGATVVVGVLLGTVAWLYWPETMK
ncbi:MAG: hypothetical protein M3069_29030 [Chloroflexota bacterium]|nr:hypothetical protein [Chloroflexota bacterium]